MNDLYFDFKIKFHVSTFGMIEPLNYTKTFYTTINYTHSVPMGG